MINGFAVGVWQRKKLCLFNCLNYIEGIINGGTRKYTEFVHQTNYQNEYSFDYTLSFNLITLIFFLL